MKLPTKLLLTKPNIAKKICYSFFLSMANYLECEANKRRRLLISEGKKIQQIEPKKTELILKIFKGFVTDERKPHKGEYDRVMAYVDVEDEYEYETERVKSFNGFSIFNEQFVIPIDSPAHRYLYIELVRRVSCRDPGTSNGFTVMGRAKIKLPPWTSRKEFKSRVDLVGLNKYGCLVIKGYLELAMKLHRYVEE